MDAATLTPTVPFTYDRTLPAPREWGASLEPKEKKQIQESAKSFESMFVSEMMNYMFTDTDMSENKVFGGGEGEKMYQSLLVNEYAGRMSSSGQAAIAPTLEREMLKMQELQRNPSLATNPHPIPSTTPTIEVSHDSV